MQDTEVEVEELTMGENIFQLTLQRDGGLNDLIVVHFQVRKKIVYLVYLKIYLYILIKR